MDESNKLVDQDQVEEALQTVTAAFPRFADWEYSSERNEAHPGFAVWGEFVMRDDDEGDGYVPKYRFYVTFDMVSGKWQGTFSIGKHAYYWSSADYGDAYLVNTGAATDTLPEAIEVLKARTRELLEAVTG